MSLRLKRWPGVLTGLSMLVGIAVVPLGMAGCSKDKITAPGPPSSTGGVPSILIGTWKFQSATVEGIQVPLKTIFGWPSSTTGARIRIGADSSLVYEEQNAEDAVVSADTAKFSIVADRFLVTPGTLPSDSGSWSVTGSELDLSGNLLGYTYDLKATKTD
jgi:hypothetical protein